MLGLRRVFRLTAQARERRRSPRLETDRRVTAEIVSLGMPVTLRDVAVGGMSIETSCFFTIDSTYDFRFRLGDGWTIDLSARIVYCRRDPSSEGVVSFVSGLEFVTSDATERAAAEDLVARLGGLRGNASA